MSEENGRTTEEVGESMECEDSVFHTTERSQSKASKAQLPHGQQLPELGGLEHTH